MVKEEEPKVTDDERFCFKCKRTVHRTEYNHIYQICDKCVNTSRTH